MDRTTGERQRLKESWLLHLSGIADVLNGGRKVALATYELDVDFDDAPRVTGWIQPTDDDGPVFLESGPILTLVLEDRRRLDFVVARPRTTSVLGRFDIAALGGFYQQTAPSIRFLS